MTLLIIFGLLLGVSIFAWRVTKKYLEKFTKWKKQVMGRLDQIENEQKRLSHEQQIIASSSIFNSLGYQTFNRRLQPEQIDVFVNTWADKLRLELTPRALAYLANRICILEQISRGRLATPIENVMLRVLVSSAVKGNTLQVLEIGTLFGIGLSTIYDHCRDRYESVKLVAIDPLDGYYGKAVKDILTGEIISETSVRLNFDAAGIPADDYKLIKCMSNEAQAMEQAKASPSDVLIIDGDHTLEGVKADFENYWRSVKPGGYIIFDDYDAPAWPDIKKYVDESVQGTPGLAFVGASFRSAVFQVQ
jgi:predicted O-methyltransferase YrrM